MKITFLGTTTLLFDDGKDQILFDCHITRPSLLKYFLGKMSTDEKIADEVIDRFDINRLKAIFVSHSHHDHVLDVPYFANRSDCDVFGSASAINVALGNGVDGKKCHDFKDEMNYLIGSFKISVIPSIHSKPYWFNDDLGQEISEPFKYPASKRHFKEGGSFDFLVKHMDASYLIRPSYNYLEGQLDDINADVLFLGLGGMAKDDKSVHDKFFYETIHKVNPKLVIPIHFDNFFSPLFSEKTKMPKLFDDSDKALAITGEYCRANNIIFKVLEPLGSIEIR